MRKKTRTISALHLFIASLLVASSLFSQASSAKSSLPSTSTSSNHHDAVASPHFLTEVNPKAKCLDGSSGVIYVSPSPDPANTNWVIGSRWGGWCSLDVPINLTALGQDAEHTVDHCYSRSLYYKGSTANVTSANASLTSDLASGAPYVSRDSDVNPVMHDWNFAWLLYCDGTSLSGRADEPIVVDGPLGERPIYLTGSYIREAAYELLRDRFGLGGASGGANSNNDGNDDSNHNVVIAGQSAGGLATMLHINWWGEQLLGENDNNHRVFGVTDGGYFLDYDTSNTTADHEYFVESYHDQMRYLYGRGNLDVNHDCKEHFARSDGNSNLGPESCMFAQHMWPFLRHPIFVLNSQYDEWQIKQMLGYTSVQHADKINAYGSLLSKEIINSVTGDENLRHGAFIDACEHHLFNADFHIDGVSMMTALSDWMIAHIRERPWDNVQQVFFDEKMWPCDGCCPTEYTKRAEMVVMTVE